VDEQHASIPLGRVRAGELRWEKFLYELKAGPAAAGGRPPARRRLQGNRPHRAPGRSRRCNVSDTSLLVGRGRHPLSFLTSAH
jgi:hypothetical protein